MPKIAKYNATLQCYAHMIQAFSAEEVEKIREIEGKKLASLTRTFNPCLFS